MKEKLLFILNPKAGTMRGKDNFYAVCSTFCDANIDLSIRMTRAPGHATQIALDEAAGYDRIVCCGGDGTLHEVVCGLMQLPEDSRPPLGYIPAGTTNDFATNFGLPTKPALAAERIVNPSIISIDVGVFGEPSEHNYFTYVASTGAFADSSYRTPQKVKNAIGYLAYILDGITRLGSIRPIHMHVEADGKVFDDEYIYASVSNSTTVAKMIKLDNIGVDMTDGLFELILIKRPKNLRDTREIAEALLSPNSPKAEIVRAQSSEIHFCLDEGSAWTLDGEMANAPSDFTVRNLCRTLKFIK